MKNTFFTYGNNNSYCCNRCKWQGEIPKIEYGNYNEKFPMYDVVCPSCGKFIGYWLAPIICFLLPLDINERNTIIKDWLCSLFTLFVMHKREEDKLAQKKTDNKEMRVIPVKQQSKKNNLALQLKLF